MCLFLKFLYIFLYQVKLCYRDESAPLDISVDRELVACMHTLRRIEIVQTLNGAKTSNEARTGEDNYLLIACFFYSLLFLFKSSSIDKAFLTRSIPDQADPPR